MSNIQTGAERMPHDLSHLGFLAGQIGRLITISTTPVDRKSGSAGMPRPISYAVFCLKKKNTYTYVLFAQLICVYTYMSYTCALSIIMSFLHFLYFLSSSAFFFSLTRRSPRSTLFPYTTLFRSDKLCLIFKLAPSVCRMTFPILASLLVRLVVLLPFQLLR